jgi:hypothetical protein
MGTVHVNFPERRDRLWLINAFAVVLLTLLGAAGEALGYDRMLKTNTVKRRVHFVVPPRLHALRSTFDVRRVIEPSGAFIERPGSSASWRATTASSRSCSVLLPAGPLHG